MKIERIACRGIDSREPWVEDSLSTGLNYIPQRLPQVLSMVGAMLWGERPWLGDVDADGQIELVTRGGHLRVSHSAVNGAPRISVSRGDGGPAPGVSAGGIADALPRELAGNVLHLRGDDPLTLDRLLSEPVARAMQQVVGGGGSARRVATDIEPLLRRRDEIAQRLETSLAQSRERAVKIDRELAELSARRAPLVVRLESAEQELSRIEAQLASAQSQARYDEIARAARASADERLTDGVEQRIEELDGQVDRWRRTLSDLQLRESAVRGELADVRPKESKPGIALADTRASLAVVRRLLRDLEGEVARFARAAGPGACVCQDAHPRLDPLVATLGEHVARLSLLADQQGRALHWGQLEDEAEHIGRSQSELRQQLECLLSQREELLRSTRLRVEEPADRAAVIDPAQREALARRRRELVDLVGSISAELAALDAQDERRRRDRAAGMSAAELDALREELRQIESELADGPHRARRHAAPSGWRASDLLAKLSDGRLVDVDLARGGRSAVVTSVSGQRTAVDDLPPSDRQLLALSFALALASELATTQDCPPLLADEPFAGLDDRHTAIAAGVLCDFAARGAQVLLWTENRTAIERFELLGAHRVRNGVVAPRPIAPVVQAPVSEPAPLPVETPVERPAAEAVTQRMRLEDEFLLRPEDAIERFPVRVDGQSGVFQGSRVSVIADLLSADPEALAQELRHDVPAELVALWQTHVGLVCFVQGLTLGDAQLLTSVGVFGVSGLAELDAGRLIARCDEIGQGDRIDLEKAQAWIARARTSLTRVSDDRHYRGWRQWADARSALLHDCRLDGRAERHSPARPPRRREERSGEPRVKRGGPRRKAKPEAQGSTKPSRPRFYLETSSPVVDAPAIGPKMAESLARLGVRTVDDLLTAEPDALAERLDRSGVDAQRIVAWQHQSRLVCRVPGMRGHDAQILVASGFTTPEEIARIKPEELLAFVEPFCQSTEGQRVLRTSPAPDLEEVTHWVGWARKARELQPA
ncbi:hypothetical protein Pla175_33960 [Pirellulimonas nuda]|uniref:DUF4332 domain-containing protein n=1 Tax=Pirellulimonas nuda TaxID=2528009 RepID=A0A518DEV4_9BACT|nr:DUF4332 domain-containing protein [Pirellulimonas nuda]QDU89997.1 hypothetical protein Pla175_33960 [Pirellulimonas nuda]